MDEIYAYARSSNEVDESKSTRPLRFRCMQVEDARSFRSKRKMECPTRRIQQSNSYRELFGIDGQTIEFEWHIFPGRASLEASQKIQNNLQDQKIEPEHFERRIIFMSMFNDIDWAQ